MGGTVSGGKKTAKTIELRYGKDFYSKIGKIGGSRGHNGGYASDKIGPDGRTGRERASLSGKKGGKISRRGKNADTRGKKKSDGDIIKERSGLLQEIRKYWRKGKNS